MFDLIHVIRNVICNSDNSEFFFRRKDWISHTLLDCKLE